MRVNITRLHSNMTEKHKITNLEAHTRYVKKFKSNNEAARQFLDDEGFKKGKELEKKWAFRFLSLRSKWSKMNKGKSKRSQTTITAFHNFQEEAFYEAMDSSSAEACALVDTSISGEGSSGRDSIDVPQGAKECLLSPLNYVKDRPLAAVGMQLFHK